MKWATLAALLFLPNAFSRAESIPFAEVVSKRACSAIGARVDASAGAAPVLLRSYDQEPAAAEPDQPALRTAAFTYDNALAVIALIDCGKPVAAARIGEALRLAISAEPRLRNAYRAGAVGAKPLANGWWDASQNHWAQDAYQQGTATGNVAWTALAMLALDDATHDPRWRAAAVVLATWALANTADARSGDGFSAGIEGFDADPKKLSRKSTEENIDLNAVFARLEGDRAPGEWKNAADRARRFVDAQWDASSGHFLVGTSADGRSPNRDTSGLDVQLWAQLLPRASPEWRRALGYVEREHGVAGGFDFNTDRDGLWLEGTAQAALSYRVLGREADAAKLLGTIAAQFAEGGFVYATREPRITTGLALNSASTSADFYYYRKPHLAATAWAAFAALDRNPFAAK